MPNNITVETSSPSSPISHVELTQSVLCVSQVSNLVSDPQCGAISLFVGTTRDLFEDKEVVSLEYEAYAPMAEKEMTKMCHETRELWPVQHIAIVHR